MFPTRYFPDRFYAPRYFPKVGAVFVGALGDEVTTAIAYFRRTATSVNGAFRRTATSAIGYVRRTVTAKDTER